MNNKKSIIDEIIMIETDMFLTVPVKEKASCQNFPERLRRFREAQFLPLSEKILKSYLNDLYIAKNSDENLMTYKYARMDDLIKPKSINPLIKKIMILQLNWQFDFFRMYPEFGKKARPVSNSNDTDYQTSFETYLSCELETYSDETLELLYDELLKKAEQKVNLSEEIYEFLAISYGYDSLEQAEKLMRQTK